MGCAALQCSWVNVTKVMLVFNFAPASLCSREIQILYVGTWHTILLTTDNNESNIHASPHLRCYPEAGSILWVFHLHCLQCPPTDCCWCIWISGKTFTYIVYKCLGIVNSVGERHTEYCQFLGPPQTAVGACI